MPPDNECHEVRAEVKAEINILHSRLGTLLENVHKLDTKVEVLVNRAIPPCEKMREEIDKLKGEGSVWKGKWSVIVSCISAVFAVASAIFIGWMLGGKK